MARTKSPISNNENTKSPKKSMKSTKVINTTIKKSGDDTITKQKKPRRFRPGTRSEWDARRLRKGTGTQISKKNMNDLGKEILYEFNPEMRMQKTARIILQCAEEAQLIRIFEKCGDLLRHFDKKKRVPGAKPRNPLLNQGCLRIVAGFYMKDVPAPAITEY